MAAKHQPIQIYPEPKLRKLIEKEAKERKWKLGPTVMHIVEQFFQEKATKQEPEPAAVS
jgi:hypothetical protein